MGKVKRKHAPVPAYISPNQLTLNAFKSPFERELNPKNRWVILAGLIPWDEICSLYLKNVNVSNTGRPPLNPRIVIGSLIIKHMCNLDDRETVDQMTENIYMQYFLGYSSFTNEPPFDASLFVDFRKRLGIDSINSINEKIAELKASLSSQSSVSEKNDKESTDPDNFPGPSEVQNKGRIIFDATACPQDIAYPTDLDLLSDAREKSEQLIDKLYRPALHEQKPRTYRKVARKRYLQTAQKKNKTHKEIRKATGSQLRFLKRNLNSINRLLDSYKTIPLKPKNYKYLLVINTLYDQQKEMYNSKVHRIEDRIVSIHQPHVRPIVRGKSQAKVMLLAKPLGRPSAVQKHVSPGERNPIEGKFGQAKTAYGLNRVKARLRGTSESWIASIILVLNLVKLAGAALPSLIFKILVSLMPGIKKLLSHLAEENRKQLISIKEMLISNQVEIKCMI